MKKKPAGRSSRQSPAGSSPTTHTFFFVFCVLLAREQESFSHQKTHTSDRQRDGPGLVEPDPEGQEAQARSNKRPLIPCPQTGQKRRRWRRRWRRRNVPRRRAKSSTKGRRVIIRPSSARFARTTAAASAVAKLPAPRSRPARTGRNVAAKPAAAARRAPRPRSAAARAAAVAARRPQTSAACASAAAARASAGRAARAAAAAASGSRASCRCSRGARRRGPHGARGAVGVPRCGRLSARGGVQRTHKGLSVAAAFAAFAGRERQTVAVAASDAVVACACSAQPLGSSSAAHGVPATAAVVEAASASAGIAAGRAYTTAATSAWQAAAASAKRAAWTMRGRCSSALCPSVHPSARCDAPLCCILHCFFLFIRADGAIRREEGQHETKPKNQPNNNSSFRHVILFVDVSRRPAAFSLSPLSPLSLLFGL